MDDLEQVELQDNQLSGLLPAWGGNLTVGQVGGLTPRETPSRLCRRSAWMQPNLCCMTSRHSTCCT